jgi:integrase
VHRPAPPIAEPLRAILRAAWMRQGQPSTGPVCTVSAMSGKLAKRATDAWACADKKKGIRRDPPLERITLHECRHTYASFLMADGCTLKEIIEYMGHANLAMVQRYVHPAPQDARF